MIKTAFLSFFRNKKVVLYITSISITISIWALLIQTKCMLDDIYIDKIENNIKNRTIYISSDEKIDSRDILKQKCIVEVNEGESEYSCLAIIDKYENVDIVMKSLRQNYSCNIYDTSGLYDIKIYNTATIIILVFIIIITIFVYLLIMLVVNSIIDGENKDIAILKAIGYTNKHILKIIFLRIATTVTISFFIGMITQTILQNIEKNIIEKILEINILIRYDIKKLFIIFGGLIFICSISALINNKKINKINAITLLKED